MLLDEFWKAKWDAAEDIGSGVRISYYSWKPDRALNPHYANLPDADKAGIFVYHLHAQDDLCVSTAPFRIMQNEAIEPNRSMWDLHSLFPLHLEPSILQMRCGMHGHIREGRWQPC